MMRNHTVQNVRQVLALFSLLAVCCLAFGASAASAQTAVPDVITPADVADAPVSAPTLAGATTLPIPAAAVPRPPGPPWSFSVGVSFSGLTVRATSGYAQLNGLIRWDKSYRFTVSITDYPFKKGRISAGGTLTGADIFTPIPVSGLTGYLTGPMEIAPNTSILSGAISWTAAGFAFNGGIRLKCTEGSLDATATVLLVDEKNFAIDALGQASACTFGRSGRVDGRTFYADISSTNGKLIYDAGIAIGRLDLFTLGRGRSTTSTYLSNVAGSITSPDGTRLQLAFKGTGGADLRNAGLPTIRLKGTVSGSFAIRGSQLTKYSVRLSGVSINGLKFLPTLGLGQTLIRDTTTAFTTPAT